VIEAVDIHLPPTGLHFETAGAIEFRKYERSSKLAKDLVATVPSVRFVAAGDAARAGRGINSLGGVDS
jgi:hypothetical protein